MLPASALNGASKGSALLTRDGGGDPAHCVPGPATPAGLYDIAQGTPVVFAA
jgi:hypothetical protein